MVSTKLRVGIIGAGTSGVYLANLLIGQGFQVDVFERSPHPRTEGCGILLVSAGMKALHQGKPQLCQRIIDSGVTAKTFEFRNLRDQIANSESVSYKEDELPGVLVHRGAILQALLEELPQDCLHLNAQFKSVSQSDAGVIAQFADGSCWEGDLLVGADGIFSKVREFVVPGVLPIYLGDLVWRGVTSDNTFCTDGKFIVYMRARGIYSNFFDIGNGYTHWGFFLEMNQKNAEVGMLKPEQTTIPYKELAKLPDPPRAVIESTPQDQINCRFSYDIDPLPRLYLGRIILIGDAAHAKSPTRARGMTAGFEDALTLSQYLASSVDVDHALEFFQSERMPIVHEYQRTSRNISSKIGRLRGKKSA
jgi:2-polyprenyl-6-methoxyphenol hydroxylase-like FAD-dependent oxidoreductase